MPPPRQPSHVPLLKALGANIQSARKKRDLTQEQLAELVEVHSRIVQKIEAGKLNPKTTTMLRIQAYLDAPWDALMPKVRPEKRPVKKPRG